MVLMVSNFVLQTVFQLPPQVRSLGFAQHLWLLRLILKHRQIRLESIKALLPTPTPGGALTIVPILLLLRKQLLHAMQ